MNWLNEILPHKLVIGIIAQHLSNTDKLHLTLTSKNMSIWKQYIKLYIWKGGQIPDTVKDIGVYLPTMPIRRTVLSGEMIVSHDGGFRQFTQEEVNKYNEIIQQNNTDINNILIKHLPKLETLYQYKPNPYIELSSVHFPDGFSILTNLTYLNITKRTYSQMPISIKTLIFNKTCSCNFNDSLGLHKLSALTDLRLYTGWRGETLPSSLTRLDITNSRVKIVDSDLSNLTNLRSLTLNSGKITPTGLQKLPMTITRLDINGFGKIWEGITKLSNLTNLTLSTDSRCIPISCLRHFPKLTSLSLPNDTRININNIHYISTNLTKLSLPKCKHITTKCLLRFSRLMNLNIGQTLHLDMTKIPNPTLKVTGLPYSNLITPTTKIIQNKIIS